MRYLIVAVILLFLTACQEKKKTAIRDPSSVYTCSMHPQVMQDRPGKCPICGMELIKANKIEGVNADAIMLSDQQLQLGNIHVDTVAKGLMGDKTILTATLNIDETKTNTVSTRVSGRIDRLYFKNQGDFVSKGQKLYDLYSEQLNNAKQEYILALEKQATLDNSIIDFKQLIQSSKTKLSLWGMSGAQINELTKTKKTSILTPYYSPASGYITALDGHEGDFVAEGATIMRLADLSTLWAEAQVYTSELSAIDRDASATVQLPDLGKEIVGHIQFINPEINPATRINLIRVAIPNTDKQLRPGMPAYVVLKGRQRNTLTLPVDAVIRNEKNNIVWIQVEKNTFKSVMVETGQESNDQIEIKSGLNQGDIIVTTGAYLINSEYIFKKGVSPDGIRDSITLKK